MRRPSKNVCDNFCVPTTCYSYLKFASNILYVTIKRVYVDIYWTYSELLWMRMCDGSAENLQLIKCIG